jgi:Tricorn protease C1 domain
MLCLTLTALLLAPIGAAQKFSGETCTADVAFALDRLETECGGFFELKPIDWKQVRKEFRSAASAVQSAEAEHLLLWRLLARLEDGHARVQPGPKGEGIGMPETPLRGPLGLALCPSDKRFLVKRSFSGLGGGTVQPGWEVTKIDGVRIEDWIERRTQERRDLWSFSTDQQALYSTCHWSLEAELGTKIEIEFKTEER